MNGLEIKEKRKKLHLTQQELADLIGVSKNTILNYEKGLKIPDSKITILNKVLNPNNTYNEIKKSYNIASEPNQENYNISGFDKIILDTIQKIEEKEEEIKSLKKDSIEYKLTLESIELLKDKITIIKIAKDNHEE